MKELILKVVINQPVADVFWFTTDPSNTPDWIDGVDAEECFPWPPQVGATEYRNCENSSNITWTTYLLTDFVPNEVFELTRTDQAYVVRYTYKSVSSEVTELTYHEWSTVGDLENPFPESALQKLKQVMESK